MAGKTFKLEIVTPEQMLVSKDAISITVPGVEGSLGILPDHAPLMAELSIGVITFKDADYKETDYVISGGFIEVNANVVRILADTAEAGDQIDVSRAEEALKRAEERLRSYDPDIDMERAESALKRALTRIRTAHKHQ